MVDSFHRPNLTPTRGNPKLKSQVLLTNQSRPFLPAVTDHLIYPISSVFMGEEKQFRRIFSCMKKLQKYKKHQLRQKNKK